MKKIVLYSVLIIIISVIIYVLVKPGSIALLPPHLVSILPVKYGQLVLSHEDSYLIKDISVIPMNRDTILLHHNVLVEDGRIKQVASLMATVDSVANTFVINGTGKYLIPGLNDMHVHINDDNNLLLFVANGVTTVRNMAGAPFDLTLRERINKRELLGPTLYTASPILEGPDKVWTFSIGLKTKSEARNVVKQYKKEGYDFIKVYHTLPEDLYREILRVSDSVGIPVVGHIPFYMDLEKTLSLSQYSLEHIDVRPISPGITLLKKMEMIAESRKWMCPTLIVYKNIQKRPNDPSIPMDYERYVDKGTGEFWRQRLHYFNLRDYSIQKSMAKVLFLKGGRLIVGTDCLNSYVLAGFSIHDELEELVSAGLPEFDVLKASTVNPAAFLKRQDDIGTIEIGKIADLVLLNGNPLKKISNTRDINGVMVRGKWLSAREIHTMLNDIKSSYSN